MALILDASGWVGGANRTSGLGASCTSAPGRHWASGKHHSNEHAVPLGFLSIRRSIAGFPESFQRSLGSPIENLGRLAYLYRILYS
jgi:hypothetical protein